MYSFYVARYVANKIRLGIQHKKKMFKFSGKIPFSRQNNHWLSQTRSSLLKFSAQYRERG